MLTRPPGKARPFAPSVATVRSAKQAKAPLQDRELFRFLQVAGEMLNSEQDQREMIKILTTAHPELETGSPDLQVDVTKLPSQTIFALRDYMRDALSRQGKRYAE
jgi:hypothetical protein